MLFKLSLNLLFFLFFQQLLYARTGEGAEAVKGACACLALQINDIKGGTWMCCGSCVSIAAFPHATPSSQLDISALQPGL